MKFDEAKSFVGHLPAILNDRGKYLYDFIIEHEINSALEIGFFHGKSTIYIAAALEERKGGKVISIDLANAVEYKPNLRELIVLTGLSEFIQPIFSAVGSQWEMRNMIQEATSAGRCVPKFDLCFIDAFHSWEKAGLDFFLCEKLLNPGGWLLFDDLDWSFDRSPTWRDLPETKRMPVDYRMAFQVGDVFELLVRQHPSFSHFQVSSNWGLARKKI